MEALPALAKWLAHVADLIVGHDPWLSGLTGLAVGLCICPGYMYLLAVISEGRWPRYAEQFKAFMPGNLFLSVVFGAAAYLTASYRVSGGASPLYQEPLWTWIPFGAAVLLVVVLSVGDIVPSFSYKPGDTNKYHWRQLISWTKVWHNVGVYGAYGFLLIRLGVPGVFRLRGTPWGSTTCCASRCWCRWFSGSGTWLSTPGSPSTAQVTYVSLSCSGSWACWLCLAPALVWLTRSDTGWKRPLPLQRYCDWRGLFLIGYYF